MNVGGGEGLIANADDVALNFTELTNIEGNAVAAADEIAVHVDASSVHRVIAYQDAGIPVETAISTTQTFVDADMNRVHQLSGSTDRQWSLNTGVGVQGNFVVLVQTGTGSIEIAGTSTVNSANGLFTRTQYSVALLLCVATDSWIMYGDTAGS